MLTINRCSLSQDSVLSPIYFPFRHPLLLTQSARSTPISRCCGVAFCSR